MKRLMTGLAFCTLALAVASANAADIWIGEAVDVFWTRTANWQDGTPPLSGDVDIYASNLDPNAAYQQATARWAYGFPTSHTFDTIEVVSDPNYAMTLQKSGTGTMNAGALTLEGYSSSKVATLDVDQNMSASSTTVKKDVNIDIEANDTFTAGSVSVGNGSVYADLLIGSASGTGELDATSLTLTVGDAATEHAYAKLDYGTLDVNGEVELNASQGEYDAEAELEVSSGATFSPNSLDLNGGNSSSRRAILDFNETVTVVDGGSSVFDGFCDIDIAENKTFTARATTVNATRLASDVVIGYENGTGTFAASTLTITAGDAASEDATLKLSAGTLDVNGAVTVQGAESVAADATIWIYAGTFTPDSMEFDGRDHATEGHAYGDFDQTVALTANGAITVKQYVDIDVFTGKMLSTTGTMTIGNTSSYFGNLDKTGSGTISVGTIVINGGSAADTVVTVSGGSIVTSS